MLFDTEKKAENFIKFNSEEIEKETGFKPERSYFCIACNGWHLTHKKIILNIKSRTEVIQDLYNQEREQKELIKAQQEALKIEQQKAVRVKLEIELQKALEKKQQKALEKEKKAQRKEQEKEQIAEKREQKALKRVQKKENLRKSLGSVELYIAILKKLNPTDEKFIEILNKAFAEFENAKSISFIRDSRKRKEKIEENLNSFRKKIKKHNEIIKNETNSN